MFTKRITALFVAVIMLVSAFIMPASVYAEEEATQGKVLVFSKRIDSGKLVLVDYFNTATALYTKNGHIVNQKVSSTETYTITQEDLEGTNLVMLLISNVAFTQPEIDLLAEYLDQGGRLFLQAEHGGFCGMENEIFSQMVKALGGDFEITSRALSVRINNEANNNLGETPLLDGISELISAYVAPMNCEGSVVPVLYDSYTDNTFNDIYMVDQAVGNGRITAISDVNIYRSSAEAEVERLMLNLLTDSIENQNIVQSGGNPNAGFGGSPNAIVTAQDISHTSNTEYTFKVIYQGQDGVTINQSTIDVGDVAVKDENSGSLSIANAQVTDANDPVNVEVTYTVAVPEGGWVADAAYTIQIINAEVEDVNGRQVGGNNNAATFVVGGTSVHTVDFVDHNGSILKTESVNYGERVPEPAEPEREGYTFQMWCQNEELTTAWDFDVDRMPASDLTLYAKWEMIIDTDLAGLSVSGYSLNETFDPSVTSYVVSNVIEDTVEVTARVMADQFSTVSVDGVDVTTGSAIKINLVNGANPVDIVVTAQDNTTTKTYSLVVNKLSDVANLASLSVEGYELKPAFDKSVTSYGVHVVTGSAISVSMSSEDDNATIDFSQYEVTTGGAIRISVPVGLNLYEFKVTADNRIDEKTYVLAVDRDNNDASPQNIEVLGYGLSPAFDGNTLSYKVDNTAQDSVDVRVTMSEYDAIRVNGILTDSGESVTVPLSVGKNTITVSVTAENGIHVKDYKLEIYRNRLRDKDDDRNSGKTEDSAPNSQDQVTMVIVNGKQGNIGKESVQEVQGNTTATVTVDRNAIMSKINAAQENGQNVENTVVVPVMHNDADTMEVKLTGDVVKSMESADFKLIVQTMDIEYVIPAKELQIESVAKLLNVPDTDLKSIEVDVTIDKLQSSASEVILRHAESQELEVVAPPVEFNVKAKALTSAGEERSVEVDHFSRFVERRVRLDDAVDPSKITTGVLYNADGTFSHIPTKVIVQDGVYYAEMNSMTNSSYSVVYHPVEVDSVRNHWAEGAVNNLASRLVIDHPESFEPDRAITRGDFIEYVVKGLGLYKSGVAHEMVFTDMKPEYADALTIAKDYHIVSGYPDGSIKAESEITREEAMVILNKALDVVNLMGEPNPVQPTFVDSEEVSDWAKAAVDRITGLNIMNGIGHETLDPKGTFTYAQAAASIEIMLMQSDLIND